MLNISQGRKTRGGFVYDLLANIWLLLGISSAFVFDSFPALHVTAAIIGVIAGIAAIVQYFGNQWEMFEIFKDKPADNLTLKA
jgi:hypothetical protein